MNLSLGSLLFSATLAFAGGASAQTKVIIGHFGDPAPYKAAIADGRLEKATGWTIEWREFNSGAEVNAAMASGGIVISEIGSVLFGKQALHPIASQIALQQEALPDWPGQAEYRH